MHLDNVIHYNCSIFFAISRIVLGFIIVLLYVFFAENLTGCLKAGSIVTTYPAIVWQLGHVVTK